MMSLDITVFVTIEGKSHTVAAQSGMLLTEVMGLAGHSIDQPCGGRGVCNKCRVVATGELSPPTALEIKALSADLEKGLRLACVTRVLGDAQVTLQADSGFATAVTSGISCATAARPMYSRYGAAVDIGTTTLAAKLCHGGAVVAEGAAKNPQTAFGSDVISRIGRSLDGGGDELAQAVRQGVNELLAGLCKEAGVAAGDIDAAVITGNTAMLYLLTGRSPVSIASAPFAADWLAGEYADAAELGIAAAKGARVYLPRCMGAFVGADIVTAITATGMTEQSGTTMLADIGTNGELALWHGGELFCCSTAAGPAFEGAGIAHGMHGVRGAIDHVRWEQGEVICTVIGGAEPAGLCGSAVVDAVSVMLQTGALDETGRIEPDDCLCADRITAAGADLVFALAGGVGLYGRDVRAVQLAKSAVCAGLETLLAVAGTSPGEVDKLYIAGGFGSYLNLDSAVKIGLIQGALRGSALSVGNAALSGAVMLLEDSDLTGLSGRVAARARVLDLGSNPLFMDSYVENMGFNYPI